MIKNVGQEHRWESVSFTETVPFLLRRENQLPGARVIKGGEKKESQKEKTECQ